MVDARDEKSSRGGLFGSEHLRYPQGEGLPLFFFFYCKYVWMLLDRDATWIVG